MSDGGTATLADGGQYQGELKGDAPQGVGRCKWADGSVYQGEWRTGKMHGKGENQLQIPFGLTASTQADAFPHPASELARPLSAWLSSLCVHHPLSHGLSSGWRAYPR